MIESAIPLANGLHALVIGSNEATAHRRGMRVVTAVALVRWRRSGRTS